MSGDSNSGANAAALSQKNVTAVLESIQASSASMGEALNKVTGLIEKISDATKTLAKNAPAIEAAAGEVAAAAVDHVNNKAASPAAGSDAAANAAAANPNKGGARLMQAARKLFGSTNVAMVGGVMQSPALARSLARGGARRFLSETVRQMKSFTNTARKTVKAVRGGMLSASRMANQASRKVGGVVASINSQVPEAVHSINSVTSQFGGMPSLRVLPKIGSKVTASIRAAFKSIARQAAAVAKAKSHRRRVSQKTKLGKQAGGRKSSGFLSSFF